ncbi:MAG: hypothetical protein ABJG78_02960 [Cyclobacteriaceae bacterium]
MRHIKINDLKEEYDRIYGDGSFTKWKKEAKEHLDKIEKLTPKKRSEYWSKNGSWTKLYSAMSDMSGGKCWYTESKENSSEWNVDHYRPKAKSIDEEGKIILSEGYWWRSYDWKNYRLSGTLTNLLRKGRFDEGEETFGKGNFFPIQDSKTAAQPKDMICSCEQPFLLDPIKAADVTLISFDEDGVPYETFSKEENELKHLRATLTIKCYGLKHKPLLRGRSKVWQTCEELVEKTQNDITLNNGDQNRVDRLIEECFDSLADLADKKSPFSRVVINYIKSKSIESEYSWLENSLEAIA